MYHFRACIVACLALLSLRVSGTSDADFRDLDNGRLMYQTGYMDQPYVALIKPKTNSSALSRWVCVVTLNDANEGSSGEHAASFWSEDQGRSWKGPFVVNPDLVQGKIDNSYTAVASTSFDRVYVISGANLDNITSLPGGHHISRTDELGYYIMRYSDDGGETWSKDMYKLPYRQTAIDRTNSWKGKVDITWNVDQIKSRNGTSYFMFTKIGNYAQSPPEEGYIFASDNLLTEKDASKVEWRMLPDSDRGPGAPPPADPEKTIAEEWHILPLAQSQGFFVVFRTNLGFLASTWTSDPTAASGWATTTYVEFDMKPLPGSDANATLALKNPRGPITLKRFSNGQYLLLWYNNAWTSFGPAQGRQSRNPYWLSSGRETPDGKIVFSQPEVVLYNRTANGPFGPGYPDFVEDTDGSIFVIETQKQATRVHPMPPTFLQMLWNQHNASMPVSRGLALNVSQPSRDKNISLPSTNVFPDWSSGDPSLGFTVILRLSNHEQSQQGQSLFEAMAGSPLRGVKVTIGANRNVTLEMTDGSHSASLSTDDACTAALSATSGSHFVAFVADGGPRILTAVVDGKLCDGSFKSLWGWNWFDASFGDISGQSSLQVSSSYGGNVDGLSVHSVPLYTSEVVSTWRSTQ